jgi:hypothetical protein
MIQLHPDCLVFKTSTGESIPCSAEVVTVELMGEAVSQINPLLVQEAASAVVYYFKDELGQTTVSITEFAEALEKVLNGLGFDVTTAGASTGPATVESDLRQLLDSAEPWVELLFYQRLRAELRNQLKTSPELLRFEGLHGCVKRLVGAKRWSERCEKASDQIVSYLRGCLSAEPEVFSCSLLVT